MYRFLLKGQATSDMVDPHRRLRICLWGFVALLAVVLVRAVQLEITSGDGFRAEASQPLVRRRSVPGVRGRILARDGSVLACDRKLSALAVHYRYLEEPCNRTWLRSSARSRLTPQDRRDPARVAAEESRLFAERTNLASRLAQLCGLSPEQWAHRARQIQARVEKVADSVNRRHQAGPRPGPTPAEGLRLSLLEALKRNAQQASGRITVAEQRDYHVMADELPLAVVAEVEASPQRYPGVRIVQRWRRDYPAGTLAAHVLGHLGPADAPSAAENTGVQPIAAADDAPPALCGRMGVERRYEPLLRGREGVEVELTDHAGRILKSYRQQEPIVGRDLVLTLDSRLQQAAEMLLDQALERRTASMGSPPSAEPAGGAIVVLEVQSGAVLAAASAPRFDPGWFARGSAAPEKGVRTLFCEAPSGPFRQKGAVPFFRPPSTPVDLAQVLSDPARPLFDRATAMAIPPGSVFKVVTSIALLEAGLDPQAAHFCRGYLDDPSRWRCAVYHRHREGHGDVAFRDALAQSCNVYFFHHARQLGPEALVDWSRRLGFGRPTGVDLTAEAAGTLPTPESIDRLERHPWRTADTLELAIGQGSLTVTPIQVARLMAAVANGGRLVTPHVAMGLGLAETANADDPAAEAIRVPSPQPIAGLSQSTLSILADGLAAVVADPLGTAHATVYQESVSVAGKTGTAQSGPGRPEHAWLAGYAPTARPRVAFVVVLEHSGNAGFAVGPVVKRLVSQMRVLGLLGPDHRVAERVLSTEY